MKKFRSYIFSADVIRALAIIGVVAIHTANQVYERPDFFGGISWWFAIIINAISRICIPLFIMISGFLLLKKGEKFAVTFNRIVNRLFIPLAFWTTLTYVLANPKTAMSAISIDYFLRFTSGNVYNYYFLVILIGLYFVSPIFVSYIKHEKIAKVQNLTIILVLVGIVATWAEYHINSCVGENLFNKWIPYAGIFLFGYLIASNKWKVKSSNWIKLGYFVGLVSTIILDYIYFSHGSVKILRSLPPACLSQYSDYYLSWNVVLMSITAFILLIKTNYKSLAGSFLENAVYKIARASFGIYLVSLFVVNFWDKWLHLDVDNVTIPLWSYIILRFLGVFLISYGLSVILEKIPFIKRVMGKE